MMMKMMNSVGDYDLWSDFCDMFDVFVMMNVISNMILSVDTLILLIVLICSSCDMMMILNVNEKEIDCLCVHVFDMLMVSLEILVVHLNASIFLDFV